jgi:hypothetical protein
MKIILVVSVAMNIVMSGSMIYTIGMIRSLQMILHLPMLNIIVPGNVSMFMSLIFPVAMFDVLENDYANPSMLFNFEPEEKSDDIFG